MALVAFQSDEGPSDKLPFELSCNLEVDPLP